MAVRALDDSQCRAAKYAAVAYLISFVTVVLVNFGIFARLIVRGNPAETARNILAHETLFRIGIVGDLVYCMGVVVLLTALYVILKPVDQNLALLAAFGRLVYAVVWALVPLNLFTAVRLLSGADYARAFGPDQLPVLARLYLTGFDQYYVGLLFWSLASTICAYLWFKSGYVPRALAAFGLLGSAWCAACTVALFIFPTFPTIVNLWWFDTPMALFELALSFLLLFKGLQTPLAA
ncbi:MAG: DUF4386 domain-containing protein [Acidobacteria bacterium]|nr:DUF4386 domain-containing protein [Acidobacteriota bacterium]